MRKTYRVGVYVIVDFPGGDYGDAANGAAIALQREDPDRVLRLEMRDHVIEGRIVRAMDVGTAARNGQLWVVPPHAVRSGDDPGREAPAPRERLEEAARWLAERANPKGAGVEQEGGLDVDNLIDNPQAAYFAWASAVERHSLREHPEFFAELATGDEHLRVLQHAARLRRQEW